MEARRPGSVASPPARRQTQPRRQFTPARLADIQRSERRKLCQLLLNEDGARVVQFNHPAAHDELVIETMPLWRPRTVRVRIAARRVEQTDLDRLDTRAAEAGDAEAIMIAAVGHADNLVLPARVALLTADDLIGRLERSPLVWWENNVPRPAFDRVEELRTLNRDAAILDPVGLRWLPVLALNETPHALQATGEAPQDLLERFGFRVFTTTFRFGGRRLGQASPGERLPDSLLTWPAASGHQLAALVDWKSAAAGYQMTSDHMLRFRGYVENMREIIEDEGYELTYLIVVSSSFPGRRDRHPYRGRARELLRETGVKLVYLRAVDLARLGVTVEARELSIASRERLDWESVLDRGMVSADDLEGMTGGLL